MVDGLLQGCDHVNCQFCMFLLGFLILELEIGPPPASTKTQGFQDMFPAPSSMLTATHWAANAQRRPGNVRTTTTCRVTTQGGPQQGSLAKGSHHSATASHQLPSLTPPKWSNDLQFFGVSARQKRRPQLWEQSGGHVTPEPTLGFNHLDLLVYYQWLVNS